MIPIISDVHVGNYTYGNKDFSRLDNTLYSLVDTFEIAKENNSTNILLAGDFFDKNSLDGSVIYRTIKVLKNMFNKYKDINILAITGNHELEQKNIIGKAIVSSLQWLELIFPDRFIIIDHQYREINDKVSVVGIPYFEFPEMFDECLVDMTKKIDKSKTNILMIHQCLPFDNIPTDMNLDLPEYRQYDLVVSGHIHASFDIEGFIISPGSPLGRDFGDVNHSDKGIMLYDEKTNTITKEYLDFPKFIYTSDNMYDNINEDYVKLVPSDDVLKELEGVDCEDDTNHVSTSLSKADMLKNYLEAINNKDEKLLAVGIELCEEL